MSGLQNHQDGQPAHRCNMEFISAEVDRLFDVQSLLVAIFQAGRSGPASRLARMANAILESAIDSLDTITDTSATGRS